jgi:hypothetical protein
MEDVLGGTVVLLQGDDFGLREILFKIENISYLCSSPAIDGLVIVSDDTDIPMPIDDLPDEMILNEVRVLKFVHHHIAAELLVRFEDFWKASKKNGHKGEKISEIEGIVPMKVLLISLIDQGQSLLKDAELGGTVLIRGDAFIL